jgi:hypothetical protein
MRHKQESATTVVCAVTVAVCIPGELAVPLSAELRYDAADPYAVRLSLGAPDTQPVDWVFARSLLEEGMHRSAGVGSVRVNPPHRCHAHSVGIVVKSNGGSARIEVPAALAEEFLSRSYALVPAGAESLHTDIDRALAALVDNCG